VAANAAVDHPERESYDVTTADDGKMAPFEDDGETAEPQSGESQNINLDDGETADPAADQETGEDAKNPPLPRQWN
jgi:hypothetical protein